MEEAFGTVLFVVVVLGVVVAGITLATSGKAYEEIGKNGLNDGTDRPAGPEGTDAAAVAVRDEEIRQMLEAKNQRRLRKGQAPVDIDAEIAALTRTRIDPGLEEEIRALVESRNRRRQRQGKEPLDVEAEVTRQIQEYS